MNGIRRIQSDIPLPGEAAPAAQGESGVNFADELGKALGAVEETQLEADREASKVALGGGNLHETAIALQKADIALRLATKVRNKLIDAYQEVMRMSV
ncbi:MAG TPA: flagellar hook-basal body complex protein FliE [Anaeromyxobacteraceae bacterium]|nr:flagellar hook-basal body complex protein FliE [Anaeromyxobacteraceae bacterium]